jgi:divalent metal cation (Fe/Co/Zn/Cd) transporter
MEKSVREIIEKDRDVKNINLCIVRKSGFDRIIELHLLVDGEITVRSGHLIAHRVETEIKKVFSNVASIVVHIEPSYEVVD